MTSTKNIEDVTCLVSDFSMFMPVAMKLSQHYKKVYYHTPTEKGFQVIDDFVFGKGVKGIHRLDDFFQPKIFDQIDFFVFPYILYGGLQEHLRECGKPVWGAGNADELERLKGKFYKSLAEVGLAIPPHKEIMGMSDLRAHLKKHENVFIKTSKFRGTMDTWKHRNYLESRDYLDRLTCKFGPFQEEILFYVLEEIDTQIEGGIDTYCIDGKWPNEAVLGYEKKNETYLAVVKPMDELPEIFTKVNKAYGSVLAKYGYRQFFSTEIRVKDGESYFIDPTCRTASPAGEEMLDLFGNIGEIIWKGAHGELVQPDITARCAGEAYLHWEGGEDEWKCLKVPKEFMDKVKIYGSAYVDGAFWWPPEDEEVIGCIVGLGDTPIEVVESIQESIDALGDAPISVNMASFVDLIKEIEKAETQGIEFSGDKMPTPDVVLDV